MNLGLGSIASFSNWPPPGGSPPFGTNAAENGLSVDPITGRIVLGQSLGAAGDPSQLLNAREIVMAGHPFTMRNAGNNQITIDPGLGLYLFGDNSLAANGWSLHIDDPNQFFELGTRKSNTFLTMGNSGGFGGLTTELFGFTWLSLDESTGRALLGDISGEYSGGFLSIDAVQDLYGMGSGPTFLSVDGTPTFEFFAVTANNKKIIEADIFAGTYKFGDINLANNGSFLTIDDANQFLRYNKGANYYLTIEPGNNFYTLLAGDPTYTTGETEVGGQLIAGDGIGFLFAQDATALKSAQVTVNSTNQQVDIVGINGLRIFNDANFLIHTASALPNGAAAAGGTLLNAPVAGNPTKWIPIDDAGVTRYIPAW